MLEATSRTSGSFRGELLHARGLRLLKAVGLDAPNAVEVAGFCAGHGTRTPVRLPYRPEGGPGVGFDHPELVAAFRRQLRDVPRVRFMAPVPVADAVREGDRVTGVRTAGGEIHRARLVVAADGRHSKLRRSFGLRERSRLLSYMVVAAVPRDALPEANHGHVLLGAPGPVLAYPYARERARMCIDVPLAAAGGRERLREFVLAEYARHVPGALGAAMARSVANEPVSATANHALSVKRCFVPGGVLVGDAGGCSHPLTATGMTSALHDAWLLAESVARCGLEVAALERYAELRRPFVRTREAFADALYGVFRGADPGTAALRAAVFRYWEGSERARAASMAILSGDESSALAFASEFSRVSLLAAAGVLEEATRTRDLRLGWRSVREVARAARHCLAPLLPEWPSGFAGGAHARAGES